ncbi:hypothetical protein CFC21_005579 [Triticum aestivum]|uniref:F-box domain-containing protein n=2 Tax=Triticum aestivum TaxID=4565 RepID=A0A9R1DA05_WHEAT|nr:putative F-box protein At1g47730 [Triticum aestivum]KAF6987989.1 hypothetical protein CFC21_005579 [Triticum aestivum]
MQMNFLLGTVKGRRSKRRRCPAANLTDDLVVEILSRLPARSVCRFKCVSTTWRDLISHPVNRTKLPQTLAGFFTKHDGETVPCCNGLLLLDSGGGDASESAESRGSRPVWSLVLRQVRLGTMESRNSAAR